MLTLSKQKNALIGGLLGGVGGGQLVILIVNAYTNVQLDQREAALAAGAVSTLLLWAARPIRFAFANGVAGVWKRLLHGSGTTIEVAASSSHFQTLTAADVAAITAAVRDGLGVLPLAEPTLEQLPPDPSQ